MFFSKYSLCLQHLRTCVIPYHGCI
uniref:Uncharacterized protein n=1 Tax=Arundo donax TaxID=35708 RepID=A0A0A8Z504_ARUDO